MLRFSHSIWSIALCLFVSCAAGCGSTPTGGVAVEKEIDAHFDRGYAAKSAGQNEAALAAFSKVIELDPTNKGGYFQRGLVHAEMGNHQKAIGDYTKVLELDPKHAFSYHRRGEARVALDQRQEALSDFDACLRIQPTYWIALNSRGFLHFLLGDYDNSLKDFNAAIESWDENAGAFRGRAWVWEAKKEWGKAVADHEAAIKHRLAEGTTMYHHTLIWLLATHPDATVRNGKRALELAEEAVELDDSWESQAHLAAALAEVGRFGEAITAQQKVLGHETLPNDNRSEMEERLTTLKAKMPLRSK